MTDNERQLLDIISKQQEEIHSLKKQLASTAERLQALISKKRR